MFPFLTVYGNEWFIFFSQSFTLKIGKNIVHLKWLMNAQFYCLQLKHSLDRNSTTFLLLCQSHDINLQSRQEECLCLLLGATHYLALKSQDFHTMQWLRTQMFGCQFFFFYFLSALSTKISRQVISMFPIMKKRQKNVKHFPEYLESWCLN